MWPDTSPIVRAFEELTGAAWRVIALLAVALVLLVAALPASAQPKCWPDLTVPATLQSVQQGRTAKPGEIVYAASSVGLVYGWHCTDAAGVWHRYVVGGPWTAFRPDWLAVADALWRGTEADRAAAWTQYATAPAIDTRLAGDVAALVALMPPPPAEVWLVARNSTYTTRPTYPVADGIRSTTSNGRVDVGAACDCAAVKIVSGTTTYCGVLGRADTVAVCTRQ